MNIFLNKFKRNKTREIQIVFYLVLFAGTIFGQKNTYDIYEATNKNLLGLTIEGANGGSKIKEYIDNSGIHFGKCMLFSVVNKTDSSFTVTVSSGMKLISSDTSVQDMFVTKSFEFYLNARELSSFKVYAMCGEIHDEVPRKGNFHSLGAKAKGKIYRVIKEIEKEDQQNIIGQHALWAVTDGVTRKTLVEYRGDRISIEKTVNILKTANAPCPLLSTLSNKKSSVVSDTLVSKEKRPAELVKQVVSVNEKVINVSQETSDMYDKYFWLLLGFILGSLAIIGYNKFNKDRNV
ncbi:MAG: hypothetical protein V4608_16995 [Bacteroidota bacterium]